MVVSWGFLFQITDDLLDVLGDAEKMGKGTGKDEALKKATYPALYGIDGTREMALFAMENAREAWETCRGRLTSFLTFWR